MLYFYTRTVVKITDTSPYQPVEYIAEYFKTTVSSDLDRKREQVLTVCHNF
jgi:hypothetical protein